MFEIYNLRTEYHSNPIGIETLKSGVFVKLLKYKIADSVSGIQSGLGTDDISDVIAPSGFISEFSSILDIRLMLKKKGTLKCLI